MAKKAKNTETEQLKAGDVIETDQGEKIELDEAQAESLNEQMSAVTVEESKDDSAKKEEVKEPFGTPRFNKLNRL
jgi:hypothetical protein